MKQRLVRAHGFITATTSGVMLPTPHGNKWNDFVFVCSTRRTIFRSCENRLRVLYCNQFVCIHCYGRESCASALFPQRIYAYDAFKTTCRHLLFKHPNRPTKPFTLIPISQKLHLVQRASTKRCGQTCLPIAKCNGLNPMSRSVVIICATVMILCRSMGTRH